MSFESFEGSRRGRKNYERPEVRIWASGKLAFNDHAVDAWLSHSKYVGVFVNYEETKVGVKPVAKQYDDSVYTLHTTSDYTGKLLHARGVLRALGCTRPDESMALDTTTHESDRLVEIDVSPLTDTSTNGTEER